MLHTRNGEETIEVVNVEFRMLRHERVYRLIVMERIAWADELVSPTNVVDHFAIVGLSRESSEIWVDGLLF